MFDTSADLLAAADCWVNILRVLLDGDNRVIDVLVGREHLPGNAVHKIIEPVERRPTRVEALEFRGDDVDDSHNWRKVARSVWVREVIRGIKEQSVVEMFVTGPEFEVL